jgi:Tfp pilus assembly protein PilO
MNKVLKQAHWIILLYACYSLYSIYEEYDPKPDQVKVSADKIRDKLAKNKKVKKEIDEFYKNVNEAKLKIQKVKESVEKTQQLLPQEISDVENVALLRKIGEELNIKSMSISPETEKVNGIFITKRYKFKATATYIQFLIFFERISNNKRVLNIKEVTFNKAESTRRGTIQLLNGAFSLEAYRFNPNYKVPDSDKKEESPFSLPPAPATSLLIRAKIRVDG